MLGEKAAAVDASSTVAGVRASDYIERPRERAAVKLTLRVVPVLGVVFPTSYYWTHGFLPGGLPH